MVDEALHSLASAGTSCSVTLVPPPHSLHSQPLSGTIYVPDLHLRA